MRPGPKTDEPDGQTLNACVLAARTGESLGEQAKNFRDLFIKEYIADFNPRAALVRCGFTGAWVNAASTASKLLREPYVANRIKELVLTLKETDIVTRGQVMACMWKEANDESNPGKTRVAALAHIATMLGMNKPKEDASVQPMGVLLIPYTTDDDWALMAAASQKALKSGESQVIDGAIEIVQQ